MESALWADDGGEYADDASYSPVRHQQQGRVMMLKRKKTVVDYVVAAKIMSVVA